MECIKHNGAYLFTNEKFQQCNILPRKIIQKELHHTFSLEFHLKTESSINQRKLLTMRNPTLEVIILFLPASNLFYRIFSLFINISTTSSCSLYFPVNIFLFSFIFFLLLLSALHFSHFFMVLVLFFASS